MAKSHAADQRCLRFLLGAVFVAQRERFKGESTDQECEK